MDLVAILPAALCGYTAYTYFRAEPTDFYAWGVTILWGAGAVLALFAALI